MTNGDSTPHVAAPDSLDSTAYLDEVSKFEFAALRLGKEIITRGIQEISAETSTVD